jgi:hypothetical protein
MLVQSHHRPYVNHCDSDWAHLDSCSLQGTYKCPAVEPQIWAWNTSESSHSLTHHSLRFKNSPYLFPLKSWLALNPVGWKQDSHQPIKHLVRIILAPDDQNHIIPRGRGWITLESHQGSAGHLWGSIHAGAYTDYPRAPTWSRCLVQVSVSLHQFEDLFLGLAASFCHLEGNPGASAGYRAGEWGPAAQQGMAV